MAQLPNPTPAPSPQKGYVDGYRDMADVHASVGADGWESLADQASNLKMLAAEVGYTHAYLEAYVASVDSIVALSRASIPALRGR